ncbi:MAG TPA: hypothetical protein VE397_10485 [Stellaceae bacterium]|nr:hypothetical protein [Stellaceae bacterium]
MGRENREAKPLPPSARALAEARQAPSPLVSYALKGLQRLWMPARKRYASIHRLDSAAALGDANLSRPRSDAFYTLNVLLGASRLPPEHRPPIDIQEVYRDCCIELANNQLMPYAYGMALWAGAALDLDPPPPLIDRIRSSLLSATAIRAMTAQDVAMLASGVAATAIGEGGAWRAAADDLVATLRTRYFHPQTGLFFNQETRFRRRFSSFASQVYAMLALYHYGDAFGADWAIRVANAGAAKVISLQGARGEWGWFYGVPSGRVVDFYEIYSVHQHGMAPAFLHEAAAHGVAGARDSLVKGFHWLFGDNEMGVSMLYPEKHMFYRSQVRAREFDTTLVRGCRSMVNALFGRSDRPDRHGALSLRRECRSYELAWILWSFAGRSDYPELTEREQFGV